MLFPFLGLFLLLIFIVAFFIKKNSDSQTQVTDRFWAREQEANHVRKQDISGLPYITIPFEKFSIGISEDDRLTELTTELTALGEKKILNLGSKTNTDLKMQYGPANLNELTEYDENFTTLCRLLVSYAERLISLGYEKEAVPVLEFGISCGSDNSKNYSLLTGIYEKENASDKIQWLRENASRLDSIMKQPILEKLAQFP